jgi:hypothetical protein
MSERYYPYITYIVESYHADHNFARYPLLVAQTAASSTVTIYNNLQR